MAHRPCSRRGVLADRAPGTLSASGRTVRSRHFARRFRRVAQSRLRRMHALTPKVSQLSHSTPKRSRNCPAAAFHHRSPGGRWKRCEPGGDWTLNAVALPPGPCEFAPKDQPELLSRRGFPGRTREERVEAGGNRSRSGAAGERGAHDQRRADDQHRRERLSVTTSSARPRPARRRCPDKVNDPLFNESFADCRVTGTRPAPRTRARSPAERRSRAAASWCRVATRADLHRRWTQRDRGAPQSGHREHAEQHPGGRTGEASRSRAAEKCAPSAECHESLTRGARRGARGTGATFRATRLNNTDDPRQSADKVNRGTGRVQRDSSRRRGCACRS